MAAATKPKTLAQALFTFQGEMSTVAKDSVNPHFGNKYAGLESIVEATRKVLQKCGLVVSQVLDQSIAGEPALRTVLMHPESNELIEGVCPFPKGLNAQQMGGAVTYFRRYGMLAILGLVADDDDDGNRATATTTRTQGESQQPPTVPSDAGQSVPAGALPAAPGTATLGGAIGGVV